jgi:thiol:disulfide interchange protein
MRLPSFFLLFLFYLTLLTSLHAQDSTSVIKVQSRIAPQTLSPGKTARLEIEVQIDAGFHIYGLKGEFSKTTPKLTLPEGFEWVEESFQEEPPPKEHRDEFIQYSYHEGKVVFSRTFKSISSLSLGKYSFEGTLEAMACTDQMCYPPAQFPWKTEIEKVQESSEKKETSTKAEEETPQETPPSSEKSEAEKIKELSLWRFMLAAILAGFGALAMPCVYPMIPVTISFFSKQSETSGHNVLFLAVIYLLGIILIFSSFGVLLGMILGATGGQEVASNPWVNLFITLLFVAFALSLFGVFEMRAPSFLLSKASEGSRTGGIAGVLMMGFVFALASFTCTGPFIGTLLLIGVQGAWFYPLLGMILFSATMGLPFFFLALFPKMVDNLPQGGNWMSIIKISLGFVELWAATKFAANVDQAWELDLITRPLVLSFWAGLSLVLSLFILGLIRFKDHEEHGIGPFQMLLGVVTFSLSVYFFHASADPMNSYGVWEAFLPRIPIEVANESGNPQHSKTSEKIEKNTTHLASTPTKNPEKHEVYLQLQQALAHAKKINRPVFVDFTGFS